MISRIPASQGVSVHGEIHPKPILTNTTDYTTNWKYRENI